MDMKIQLGRYEDRAAAGNLNVQEQINLWEEVKILREHNSRMLTVIRLIAGSNSAWKHKAQATLDRIEFNTDDARVIEAAKKAIAFRERLKG